MPLTFEIKNSHIYTKKYLLAHTCQTIILETVSLLQRQSRLDEVTGRTGESDGLGGVPSSQPPLTTPLERRDIPPQLSMTLEHIVGQLDVLTQVRDLFCGI